MSTSKHFDRICAAVILVGVLLTLLFMNGTAFGIQKTTQLSGYENRLFDTSRVHSIALVVEDWDEFLESCEDEEYVVCSAVIDGESYKNIALRAKGNTSLSSVRTMGSSRYSFKLEFDHFNKNETYHGLDKLCLNNIIQDNTYMKDFLTYCLMNEFGVDTPLCSYVYITVNGEDWGLYLAVEGIEDSFLQRNYGNDHGELYKPDSISMGGGRGNGREFDMDSILQDLFGEDVDISELSEEEIREKLDEAKPEPAGDFPEIPGGTMPGGGFAGGGSMPDGMFSGGGSMPDGASFPSGGLESFDAADGSAFPIATEESSPPETGNTAENGTVPSDRERTGRGDPGGGFGGGFGVGFGMGSDDVKLRYIDDDPASYSAIFDNAKTVITETDKSRLISSLKLLSEQTALEDILDIDEILRYFVVHNFVVNGDSYTGSMIHNYYLHESDGKLSMIPWDYNLAFGSFQGNSATDAVNDPIDTPLSVGSGDSRPMADWIFASEEYTEQYHSLLAAFLETFDLEQMIDETAAMIAPYVEKDPTKFCTYEEFETGVATLNQFCQLRTESVQGQLDGTIPSTDEGQNSNPYALIDASDLTLSALGSMNNGGGGFGGGPGGSSNGFDSGFPGGPGGSDSGSEGGFPGDGPGGFGSIPENGFSGGNDGSESVPNGSFPDSSFPGGDGSGFPGVPGGSDSAPSGGFPGSGFSGSDSGGSFPGNFDGGFPGGSQDGTSAAAPLSQSDWLVIGVCFAILLAGILFVRKYRTSK